MGLRGSLEEVGGEFELKGGGDGCARCLMVEGIKKGYFGLV